MTSKVLYFMVLDIQTAESSILIFSFLQWKNNNNKLLILVVIYHISKHYLKILNITLRY